LADVLLQAIEDQPVFIGDLLSFTFPSTSTIQKAKTSLNLSNLFFFFSETKTKKINLSVLILRIEKVKERGIFSSPKLRNRPRTTIFVVVVVGLTLRGRTAKSPDMEDVNSSQTKKSVLNRG
jgi:hypothetical protein